MEFTHLKYTIHTLRVDNPVVFSTLTDIYSPHPSPLEDIFIMPEINPSL